jgi:FkbM family methyltransferase
VSPANRQIELVDTPLGRYESFAGDLVTSQLKRFGGHQRPDLAMARSQLRPGDVVLDVGAHIGTFSIPFARAVQPGGSVLAFEPVPETLDVLRRNVAINGVPVTSIQAVVSETVVAMRGTAVHGNTALASFQAAGGDSEAVAPTIVLDDFYADQELQGRIGLLKVDVEGMEMHVLRGARGLVEDHRPAIMVEVNRRNLARSGSTVAELEEFLSGYGYHLFMNLAPRNASGDQFRLGRLPALRLLRAGGGTLRLVDVLAVHEDSDRYPTGAAGPGPTLSRIAGASARTLIRRGKRLASRTRNAVLR